MRKIFALIFVIVFALSGCSQTSLKDKENQMDGSNNPQQNNGTANAQQNSNTGTVDETEPTDNSNDMNQGYTSGEEDVNDIINQMTIEEKVAQLFIVDLYTYNNGVEVTDMTLALKDRLGKYPIGGFIFFDKNIVDTNQVVKLIRDLQSNTKFPLFTSVDEEGGLVSRLEKNSSIGMTKIPNEQVVGDTDNTENAYYVGTVIGSELAALGFNMDFAPVADVNTNPNNPVIGVRAFSSDQNVVADMVSSEIQGLQEQGVAAVAKHFPGHGDTSTDTHTGAVYVEHDINRLKQIELVPFQKAIDSNVMGIMAAHIALPNVANTDEPASLSYQIITELLRQDMKFDGVVITDALNMGAVADSYSSDEACVKAILAGDDVLLMPEDFELGYNGILKAVNDGTISEERINESLYRIISLKLKLGLFDENTVKQPLSVIGSEEHQKLIDAITGTGDGK